jgi:hypothetical protein
LPLPFAICQFATLTFGKGRVGLHFGRFFSQTHPVTLAALQSHLRALQKQLVCDSGEKWPQ